MKKLNDKLAMKFNDLCEDVKNAQYSEDLFFRVGVAFGFASALFLSNVIDIDCYTEMNDCINNVREQCNLGGAC